MFNNLFPKSFVYINFIEKTEEQFQTVDGFETCKIQIFTCFVSISPGRAGTRLG